MLTASLRIAVKPGSISNKSKVNLTRSQSNCIQSCAIGASRRKSLCYSSCTIQSWPPEKRCPTIWRFVFRFLSGAPSLPEKERPLVKVAAHVAHWSLYALMIFLPVTGKHLLFPYQEFAAEEGVDTLRCCRRTV